MVVEVWEVGSSVVSVVDEEVMVASAQGDERLRNTVLRNSEGESSYIFASVSK